MSASTNRTKLSAPGRAKSLIAGFFALLINSSYLAGSADPTMFYFGNVALHMLAGLGLLIGFAIYLGKLVLGAKRGGQSCTQPGGPPLQARASDTRISPTMAVASALLGLAAAFGIFLMIFGATRPYRWALYTHIAFAVAGSLLMLAYLLRAARPHLQSRLRLIACVSVACMVFVFPVASTAYNRYARQARDKIINPDSPPLSMNEEGAGTNNPFFPSSAETNVGGIIPANFFMTSGDCGRCHQDIYNQWNASAHHFSSFNNQWYRKSIEYMQDVVGTQPSKWCAGCHDHAVFFNGRFDRPIKEQTETPEAQAGLACTSCHSIVHVKSSMGQGDFEIEYPPLHDMAVSNNKLLRWIHDYLLRTAPQPHRETFLKAFHTNQTAEFCSSCHKVHLDVPVNSYRWFRGFNEYDNWQASGVSGQGARSFYYPAKAQKCADCHMPLVASDDPGGRDGKVHSHRFPAANTALPFVNQDPVQLKAEQDFLQDGQVSIDIFGLVRGGQPASKMEQRVPGQEEANLASTFAIGEESMNFGAQQSFISEPVEVAAPLDKTDTAVRQGDSVRVEVVVRTRKVGHFFPGGTVDAFDVWVELEAVDDKGQTIFHSGLVQDGGKGPVEEGAHFYRSLQLDEHGNVINKRNAWMSRSVAYVRLIPPGAADTIHYRLNIPDNCGDKIYLRAKVNYRKFSWWNTNWAFAGIRDPADPHYTPTRAYDDGKWVFSGDTSGVSGNIKSIPDIPITVMAYSEASVRVLPHAAPEPETKPFLDKSVRERWNDYGIGLLLQGDIKGAEAAFLKVTEMEPGYADGWVNVARARIQEGNMETAQPVLLKALEVDPHLAKTHFFLGTVLRNLGSYEEALQHLKIASDQYPRDRVVLNQIGLILFRQRRYAQAIAELENVLKVDPEDLQAHYYLMLCYQGLGNSELAAKEQALYKRFKADESAQFITGGFRQLHPADNNERQQIHEHYSAASRGAVNGGAAGSGRQSSVTYQASARMRSRNRRNQPISIRTR